ncbi:hypothetical protein [Parafilimonas sp.]|uniref:hypothetical protein n=1 Tax=Parafilimonas sp. TaxID=1969739 RepID=UPI003F7E4CC8
MEKEKIEFVLEDMLDELKMINNSVQEQKQQITQLYQKVSAFEEKANQANKAETPTVNIKPVEVAITTASNEIKQLIQQQSRPVIRQWRFLLFPEHNAREYYTVIFRLIMWMTLACMVVVLFSLGKQALENAKEVKLMQLEHDQFKNAWEYIFKKEDKQGKKKMDDVMRKSWEERQ